MSDEIETVEEVVQAVEPEIAETVAQEVPEVEETEAESATADDAPEAEDKPKRRSRAEERINALTREKYEAQQQAEQAAQQLRQIQEALQQQQIQQSADLPMPTLADVDYDETRYQQAIQQWSTAKFNKVQEQQAEMQRQQQEQHLRSQQEAQIMSKFQEGVTRYPDFANKVGSMPSLQSVSQAAYAAMMESDASVDIAYYLASNPQEMYGLASKSPVQAIRAVAQIESKLSARPKQSAPPPPRPPTQVSGITEAREKAPNEMNAAEFIAWRNKSLMK